jgi:tetratricopeptide (TPR) repeat protein
VAKALWGLGALLLPDGDPVAARDLLEESIATFRKVGDEHYILHVNRSLGWAYELLGDLDRARALQEETLSSARSLGNHYSMVNALGSLAGMALEQGRIHETITLMREGDAILRELGYLPGIFENLGRMANTLAVAGRAAFAAQVLGCLEALSEEAEGAPAWVERQNERTLTLIREQLDDTSIAEADAEGRKMTPAEAMALGFDSGL